MSDEEYEAMLAAQGGGCILCAGTPKTRRLHVDHDHHPPYSVRGLLCFRCNRFLHSWMSPAWLRRAADYLEGKLEP